jgi:ABC-type branched-subunit amino acid transport system substrate-binding protein
MGPESGNSGRSTHQVRVVRRVAAVAVAVALVISGCSSSSKSSSSSPTSTGSSGTSSQSATPIKIGVLMSLSGPFATLFGPFDKTVKAWQEQNPTIGGRPVQVFIQDDQGTTAGGEAATRLLIDQDHVNMMVGPGISNVAVAALPLLKQAGIVDIQPTAYVPARDPKQYPYVFADNFSDDDQVVLFAEAMNSLNVQSAGILAEDSALGHGTATAIQADKSIKLVGTQFYPTGATTLTTEEQKLQSAGAASVILVSVAPQEIIAAVQGMGAIGWKAPVIGLSPEAFPQLVQAYGPLAKQVIATGFTKATLNPLSPELIQARDSVHQVLGNPLPIPLFTSLLYTVSLDFLKYGILGSGSTDAAKFTSYVEGQGGYSSLIGYLHYTSTSHAGLLPSEAAIPDLSTLSDGSFDVYPGT